MNPAYEGTAPGHAAHFATATQQRDASKLGMWIFLATEVLFFGGLFMAYGAMRFLYPGTFLAAHHYLSVPLGGLNTMVLITSSLTMALAVRAAQVGDRKTLPRMLLVTVLLAGVFLVVKYVEYHHKFELGLLPGKYYHSEIVIPGLPHVFFGVYFVMTGLHGIHVIAGMLVIGWLMMRSLRRSRPPVSFSFVENVGLYWHLVDLIWIFLFPLLYLVK
jgi:cytochrome c oxidase subunit 3